MKSKTQKTSKLRKARRLHLAVIPHADNHYRPHLIRRYGLLLVGVLVSGLLCLQSAMGGAVLGEKSPIVPEQLLEQTNKERQARQLPPLAINQQLSMAAEQKAKDMVAGQYWAHTSPSGVAPWQWIQRAGYVYSTAGENLARGFSSADSVVAAWITSPGHRANVLGAYTEVGFAVIDGELDGRKTSIVVAYYARPATAATGVVTEIAPTESLGPLSQLGVAVRTLPVGVLGGVVLLLFVALVALLAHAYRSRLPKKLRTSLYRHHGILKAGGLVSVAIIIVLFQTGGQI